MAMIRSLSLVLACSLLAAHEAFVLENRWFRREVLSNAATSSHLVGFPGTRSSWKLHKTRSDSLRLRSAPSSVSDAYNRIGSIAFLLPGQDADKIPSKFGQSSPAGNPTLAEAAEQLAKKAFFFADGRVETSIVAVPLDVDDAKDGLFESLVKVDVLIALGLHAETDFSYARRLWKDRQERQDNRQSHFLLDSGDVMNLPAKVGPFEPAAPSPAALVPWTEVASAQRIYHQMSESFARWTSDDFCFALMVFLNKFSGKQVPWVQHSIDATYEKGLVRNAEEFYGMVTKCGDCIGKCLADDNCRTCLNELTAVDSRDQVASYRTLVSYESELLKDFSLCILTRHNIFQCDAEIPSIPDVSALETWRGRPVTEEVGRALLVGHLDEETALVNSALDVSWKVACGANVAYDQFPSQNQLFYPAARGGRDMWYDPVFRVETLDGRHVWCTRHYKVRPGPTPASFFLSVLDNGVTSSEFWNIVDAAEDLSWIVFHYAGAAKAVGQRYLGGLLCTADGKMPADDQLPEIYDCLRKAGIEPWELYEVDNREDSTGAVAAGPPPLDTYRSKVKANKAALALETRTAEKTSS